MLALLVALALGAGVALWLILAASPVGARAEGTGTGVGGAAAPPAAVEFVGPATVVATSSCVGQDPRDTVAVDGPAGRRLMPLDGCGSPLGARMTVRMAFVGAEPADAPARVLGTGSATALVAETPGASPLTGRLAILLTGVAGLGMAGLLVAVVHERRRRTARAAARATARASARASARATARRAHAATTTSRRRDTGDDAPSDAPVGVPRRTTHRPAARPARAARAGRPAGLDAGRRLPVQRTGTSRNTNTSTSTSTSKGNTRGHGGGTRRPAAGPHRG